MRSWSANCSSAIIRMTHSVSDYTSGVLAGMALMLVFQAMWNWIQRCNGHPSSLTASAFEMLIHYSWSSRDVNCASDPGSYPHEACKELEASGLMEVCAENDRRWRLTPKGQRMARNVLNTKWP